jgi:SM-20-related protein
VTCVLYLNRDWTREEGGQLLIYTDPNEPSHHEEILPLGGQLVTFLSARFLHEVLPSRRDRVSLTGWFRRRIERTGERQPDYTLANAP